MRLISTPNPHVTLLSPLKDEQLLLELSYVSSLENEDINYIHTQPILTYLSHSSSLCHDGLSIQQNVSVLTMESISHRHRRARTRVIKPAFRSASPRSKSYSSGSSGLVLSTLWPQILDWRAMLPVSPPLSLLHNNLSRRQQSGTGPMRRPSRNRPTKKKADLN